MRNEGCSIQHFLYPAKRSTKKYHVATSQQQGARILTCTIIISRHLHNKTEGSQFTKSERLATSANYTRVGRADPGRAKTGVRGRLTRIRRQTFHWDAHAHARIPALSGLIERQSGWKLTRQGPSARAGDRDYDRH